MPDLPTTTIISPTPSPRVRLTSNVSSPPGFDLLGELGRGGMGVVYKARQHGLNRIVALKLMLAGGRIDPSDRLRFMSEAEAVAAVKHDNVVQVYEYGESGGCPFLAMEYVDGGSLARLLHDGGPLAPGAAARMVEQIARGVQAAHDQGIVHRDLKPANILLAVGNCQQPVDSSETTRTDASSLPAAHSPLPALLPKVSDFGIAKRGGGADLTLTGVALGTPAYMSPEQARGDTKFVGPGADVYALGVILYECLTGRLPFDKAESVALLLQRVAHEDPPPPRQFAPGVPPDLELICLKCLQKWPHERYPTAQALAADLAKFRSGDTVSVRPPGRLEKAVRWVRRYPTRAALYGLALLAAGLGVLAGGALTLWRTADDAHTRAVVARDDAETARGRAQAAQAEAERLRTAADAERARADGARQVAETERVKAEGATANERAAKRELGVQKALHDTALAHREYEANNPGQARLLLAGCPADYRPWEWRFVDRQCRRELAAINLGEAPLTGVGFASDGAVLAAGVGLQQVDLATRKPVTVLTRSGVGLAVSADSKRVAATGSGAAVYDRATWKPIFPFSDCSYIALDGTGAKLLHGGDTGATLTTVDTKAATPLPADELLVRCGALSRDGNTVALGGQRWVGKRPQGGASFTGVVKVWQAGGRGEPVVIAVHPFTPVRAVALNAAATHFAAGCDDGSVLVCEISTRRLMRLIGHTSSVSSLAFDATGKRVASASSDRTVRVWGADDGTELLTFKGHESAVMGVAFAPDGRRLASAGFEGTVRLWDLNTPPEVVTLAGLFPVDRVQAITVTDDGGKVIVSEGATPVRAFDARTGARLWPKAATVSEPLTTLWIDSARSRVCGVSIGGGVFEWDVATGAGGFAGKRLPVKNPKQVSVDLSRAVTSSDARAVTVHDLGTGKVVATTGSHLAPATRPALSADGRRVLTIGLDRKAVLWDTDTGAKVCELVGHSAAVHGGAFSPDGARVATCGQEGVVKLWETATGREVLTLRFPPHGCRAVGWSADGSKLVALDERGAAHIWDAGRDPK